MAAGQITLFHDFKRWGFSEGVDLDDGNVRLALFGQTLTPNASTQAVFADVSAHQISHANYTAGGIALPSPAVVRSGSVSRLESAAISVLAEGVSSTELTAKWLLLYYSGMVGALVNPLVAYGDLDDALADVTVAAGASFNILQPAGGWLSWV